MSSTTDDSDVVSPSDMPKRRGRARHFGLIGIIACGLILAYLLSILAFSLSGRAETLAAPPELSQSANGVNVALIDLVGMDTVRQQMSVRVLLVPEGDYLDVKTNTWAKSMRITVPLQTSGSVIKDIPAGQPVGGGVEMSVFVEGDPQEYPFDRYLFGQALTPEDLAAQDVFSKDLYYEVGELYVGPQILFGVQVLGDDGKVDGDVDVPLGMSNPPRGLQGWTSTWALVAEGGGMFLNATVKRSGGVLAFALVILLLMITIAVLALIVAVRVWRKQRPIEATMASWFAALLFALIPLRTYMPGSPPIGAWIDATVFYWVEVALLVAMSIFIVSWLRYRKPPVDD